MFDIMKRSDSMRLNGEKVETICFHGTYFMRRRTPAQVVSGRANLHIPSKTIWCARPPSRPSFVYRSNRTLPSSSNPLQTKSFQYFFGATRRSRDPFEPHSARTSNEYKISHHHTMYCNLYHATLFLRPPQFPPNFLPKIHSSCLPNSSS